MKKLINASFLGTSKSGKAYQINIELDDGRHINTWFPASQCSVEKFFDDDTGEEGTGDIYVEDWLLEKKEEEFGAYITNEDV